MISVTKLRGPILAAVLIALSACVKRIRRSAAMYGNGSGSLPRDQATAASERRQGRGA